MRIFFLLKRERFWDLRVRQERQKMQGSKKTLSQPRRAFHFLNTYYGVGLSILENTEAAENSHIQIRASPPKKLLGSIAQLHLYQCTQHGQWTGGAGSHCVQENRDSCHHGNMLGWLTQLECCLEERHHEMMEFSVLGEVRRGVSRTAVCSRY